MKIENVTIRETAWREVLSDMLTRAMEGDPGATVETLRLEVAAGRAKLFEVLADDGAALAAAVLRVEMRETGPEGVIVAAGGRPLSGVRLFKLLPHFEARFVGVRRIRIHTARPVMARLLEKQGYAVRELVLQKQMAKG